MVSPKFKKDGYVLNIASFLSLDKFLRIADILRLDNKTFPGITNAEFVFISHYIVNNIN
jgi:hypothetical protein